MSANVLSLRRFSEETALEYSNKLSGDQGNLLLSFAASCFCHWYDPFMNDVRLFATIRKTIRLKMVQTKPVMMWRAIVYIGIYMPT